MSYSKKYFTVTKMMEYINDNFDKVDFQTKSGVSAGIQVDGHPHIVLSSVKLYFKSSEAYTTERFNQKNIFVLGIMFHGMNGDERHTKILTGDAFHKFFAYKQPIVSFNENQKRKVDSSDTRIQSLFIRNELNEYKSISYFPAIIERADLSIHNLLTKSE